MVIELEAWVGGTFTRRGRGYSELSASLIGRRHLAPPITLSGLAAVSQSSAKLFQSVCCDEPYDWISNFLRHRVPSVVATHTIPAAKSRLFCDAGLASSFKTRKSTLVVHLSLPLLVPACISVI